MSRVQTELDRPYTTSFDIVMASSSSRNGSTTSTGPKISRCTISESWATSVTTVGS